MTTYDSEQFIDGYRDRFGTVGKEVAQGLAFLVQSVSADTDWALSQHVAYFLATIKWETAHTFQPIDEHGSDDYFNRRYQGRLGNDRPGDGARYHGRGYVPLTGRVNYHTVGRRLGIPLEDEPNRAKDPGIAYRIAADGMRGGWFTGKGLTSYIKAESVDYRNARRIINGLDRADEIAALARDMETILAQARLQA